MGKLVWAALAAGLLGCNDNTVLAPPSNVCPEDSTEVSLPSGQIACKIERPIVIETGFECKSVLRKFRFDFETFSVCDQRASLPRPDLDFLNGLDLHARFPETYPASPVALSQASSLDVLWVIDNSGSMCEEQGQIISSVQSFVARIVNAGIDLQMGVTTTHTDATYELEPVARPGELQSTPQPIPGFDRECINATDASGAPLPGDFAPVRAALDVARACVADLQVGEFEWTDTEIACAFDQPAGCEIAALGCQGETCTPDLLFPPPARYRALPKVFKSSAYKTVEGYDMQTMARDLACMTLVGTRGSGIERGFEAASLALSAELAGAGRPNAGLVRPNARLGVLFVSDEDDCSGQVVEGACGAQACDYAKTDEAWGTLTSPQDAWETVVAHVASLKPNFDRRELLVASFHAPGGYTGEVPPVSVAPEVCTTREAYQNMPSCTTALGVAYGGERYSEFLRAAPLGNAYPFSPNRVTPIEGVVCEGGLLNPLSEVADFFVAAVQGQE